MEIFEVIRTATEERMHEVCKCFGEYIEHDDLVNCDRFFIAKMSSLTQKQDPGHPEGRGKFVNYNNQVRCTLCSCWKILLQ